MPLELLKHALRVKTRVRVVEPGDEAERDNVILTAINPSATIFTAGKRPAHRVDDLPGRDAVCGHFPKLLYALAVCLRVAIFGQVELGNELLGQRAASAFGQDYDFRLQVVTRLEI